jgi:hypothetical protein
MNKEQLKQTLQKNIDKIYLENIKELVENHFKGKSIAYIDEQCNEFFQYEFYENIFSLSKKFDLIIDVLSFHSRFSSDDNKFTSYKNGFSEILKYCDSIILLIDLFFLKKIKDILPDNINFQIIQFILLNEQELGIIEFNKKEQGNNETIEFNKKEQGKNETIEFIKKEKGKKLFFKNFVIPFLNRNLIINLNQAGDIVDYIFNIFEIKNYYSKKEEKYNDNLNKLLLYDFSFKNIVTHQITIPNKLNDNISVFVIPINNQIYGRIGENKQNNYTFLKESICIRETEFSTSVLQKSQIDNYINFLIGNKNLIIEFIKEPRENKVCENNDFIIYDKIINNKNLRQFFYKLYPRTPIFQIELIKHSNKETVNFKEFPIFKIKVIMGLLFLIFKDKFSI